MTFLAAAAWRTYTHPASATPSLRVGSEGWRRASDRTAFASVLAVIRRPHLPHNGTLLQSYVIVEEAAHRVGRALHAIGNQNLAEQILADVSAELDAVEQAERGDLSGRARQAIALTRADASPLQVAAADVLLADNPFGDSRLFTEVEPTAAAVAAAHWLHVAATVTARQTGLDPTQVLVEADNIEALPHESPTVVLEHITAGQTARLAVLQLIAEAMVVAEGGIPDLDVLLAAVESAYARAEAFGEQAEELREALMPRRLTPLDPTRPATDLLEDLIAGIHGCWLLYRDYADIESDIVALSGVDDPDGDSTGDELVEERITTAFLDQIRVEAASRHSELL
ncbi:hypothetical protein [Protofrankia sp. BMG5.30]|uniref:hypothetical protein n=1 Tax=Protofrankia sp. BMG5.30 TaxID=1834514 RepID=UPI0020CA3E77|nr:hypothetical protein [Protofrankia sp. BMG5.30]